MKRPRPRFPVFTLAGFAVTTLCGLLPLADAQTAGTTISLDALFTTLDRDHDGKISKTEATEPYAQRFAQWDENGDGFATRQEVHDFRTRLGIADSGRRITSPGGAKAPKNPRRPASANSGPGRQAPAATLLKEPTDWRLETMPLPPGFAPDLKFSGTEEIRFAPGMFDPNSATYFTCVLGLSVHSSSGFGAAELKAFLESYYRGLSISVGQRKGLKPDRTQMNAIVKSAGAGPEGRVRLTATVDFFDTFSDGRKITLNVEADVLPLPKSGKTGLILLVSPSATESPVWTILRSIGQKSVPNFQDAD